MAARPQTANSAGPRVTTRWGPTTGANEGATDFGGQRGPTTGANKGATDFGGQRGPTTGANVRTTDSGSGDAPTGRGPTGANERATDFGGQRGPTTGANERATDWGQRGPTTGANERATHNGFGIRRCTHRPGANGGQRAGYGFRGPTGGGRYVRRRMDLPSPSMDLG